MSLAPFLASIVHFSSLPRTLLVPQKVALHPQVRSACTRISRGLGQLVGSLQSQPTFTAITLNHGQRNPVILLTRGCIDFGLILIAAVAPAGAGVRLLLLSRAMNFQNSAIRAGPRIASEDSILVQACLHPAVVSESWQVTLIHDSPPSLPMIPRRVNSSAISRKSNHRLTSAPISWPRLLCSCH